MSDTRRTRPKSLLRLPWSTSFPKTVQSFLDATTFEAQYNTLRSLAPKVKADCFQYRSDDALRTGKECLLKLWERLLSTVDDVPFEKRGLFYSLIVAIIQRYEFDLVHLSSWTDGTPLSHGSSSSGSSTSRFRKSGALRRSSATSESRPISRSLTQPSVAQTNSIYASFSSVPPPSISEEPSDASDNSKSNSSSNDKSSSPKKSSRSGRKSSEKDVDDAAGSSSKPTTDRARTLPSRVPTDPAPSGSGRKSSPSTGGRESSNSKSGVSSPAFSSSSSYPSHAHHHPSAGANANNRKASKADLDIARRYHAQLERTHEYVCKQLAKAMKLRIVTKFCVAVLAVTYFRLPKHTGSMLAAVRYVPPPDGPPPDHVVQAVKDKKAAEKDKGKKGRSKSNGKKHKSKNKKGKADEASEEKSVVAAKPAIAKPPRSEAWKTALLADFDAEVRSLTSSLSGHGHPGANAFHSHAAIRSDEDSVFFRENPSLFHWQWFYTTTPMPLKSSKSSRKVKSEVASEPPVSNSESEVRFEDLLKDDVLYMWMGAVTLHVSRVSRGTVKWEFVPGYYVMVKVLLNKLMSAQINDWPDYVTRCCNSFLSNPRVLAHFSRALLHQTNSTNPMAVDRALDLLDEWLNITCTTMSSPIPENFCFDTFYAALSILMQTQHFQILLKTLWFFYSHCGHFYGEQRLKLMRDLFLTKMFFDLFLHWSPEVRRQYHITILYRLNRGGDDIESQLFDDDSALPRITADEQALNAMASRARSSTPKNGPPNGAKGGADGGDGKRAFKVNAAYAVLPVSDGISAVGAWGATRSSRDLPLVEPADPSMFGKVVTSIGSLFRVTQRPQTKGGQGSRRESQALFSKLRSQSTERGGGDSGDALVDSAMEGLTEVSALDVSEEKASSAGSDDGDAASSNGASDGKSSKSKRKKKGDKGAAKGSGSGSSSSSSSSSAASRFGRMVSSMRKPMLHKQPNPVRIPVPGEGTVKQRPVRSKLELERAQRELLDNDPAIEGCVVVYTPLTNEFADRVATDVALTSTLKVYIRMVSDQLRDSTQLHGYFPRNRLSYAQDSLKEFKAMKESFDRVQLTKNLEFGQILVPELCYSIVNLESLRQNDNT